MIELAKYFLILFLTKAISHEKLKQFAETHITREGIPALTFHPKL